MNAVTPPFTKVQGYHLRDRMITYETKDGEALLATGWFWIAEPVTCPTSGNRSWLLEVSPVGNSPSTLLVRPEDFNIKYLKKALGEKGVILHQESRVVPYLSITAAFGGCTELEPRILIENPGWFANDKGFYTGRKAFVAEDIDESRFRFEPVSRAPVALKGTLADWQDEVGVIAQANPILLAVMCVFMASPFLRKMGLGTRLVNIFGAKGTGKTLCSQVGATVWGNGVDPAAGLYSEDPPYITKFATTINGIEPLLSRYSPFAIGLDELTEQASALLGELTYKASSGEGKHRSKTDATAATMNRWLLTIVATAEKSIADAITGSGKPLLGGQADRAIDIPVDGIGVITDFGRFDNFQQATRHLKKACAGYYGAAGEAILQFACDNPDAITELIGLMPELEERLMPVNCGDGERRVVKFLAGAVVAGWIGIRAGALTCSEEQVEEAMSAVVTEWWRGRGGSLRRVAEFLHANIESIEDGPPRLGSSAKAFSVHDRFIIPDYVFENEFAGEFRTMLTELAGLNALIREQGSRNKSRYCNNRLFAYAIRFDRIEPVLTELAEHEESPSSGASRSRVNLVDIEID